MTVRAALSGQLVLGTVHAQNVFGVLARLEQLGVAPFYLEQVLTGVFYQRLLPCQDGKQAVLFDSLLGADLQTAVVNHKKRGMTDGWRAHLKQAVDQQQISAAVQAAFAQG